MIAKKKIMEAVIGGIIFGSVYFLCKFQVALEMDGTIIGPSSTMGHAFSLAKVFLGILAAKVAGQQLVNLIEKSWPMVQASVHAQVGSERARDGAKKTEEWMDAKESTGQEAQEDQTGQKAQEDQTAQEDQEADTRVRHRRSTDGNHLPYLAEK